MTQLKQVSGCLESIVIDLLKEEKSRHWAMAQSGDRRRKSEEKIEAIVFLITQVVSSLQPDGYKPEIIRETSDYLYVEYKSPTLGFIDDGGHSPDFELTYFAKNLQAMTGAHFWFQKHVHLACSVKEWCFKSGSDSHRRSCRSPKV